MNRKQLTTAIAVMMAAITLSSCIKSITEKDLLPGARRKTAPVVGSNAFEVVMGDGAHLRGVALTQAGNCPVVIYFGGNAEIVGKTNPVGRWAEAESFDVYAVNYRGFGPSDGAASLNAMAADAVQVFDVVSARPEVQGRPVVVMGFSLGTAAALKVASERKPAGVVLLAPPSSAAEVIPYWQKGVSAPMRWFLWLRASGEVANYHPQPIELAAKVTVPLLVAHGESDEVIPFVLGRKVFDAAPGPSKLFCPVTGANHNGIWQSNIAERCFAEFLSKYSCRQK